MRLRFAPADHFRQCFRLRSRPSAQLRLVSAKGTLVLTKMIRSSYRLSLDIFGESFLVKETLLPSGRLRASLIGNQIT